jgi:ATP phosphoribosyltransferase
MNMLRVAVPNKGILADYATAMLAEAGYSVRKDTKTLRVVDSKNNIEFFYLRPRDIATYVGTGALDLGITGLDLLMDSRSKAVRVADLNFGQSTFTFAGVIGEFQKIEQISGKRVATAYKNIVEDYLEKKGIKAEVIAAADAMSANEFTATVNDRCRMCAVKGLCPIQPQGRSVIDQ